MMLGKGIHTVLVGAAVVATVTACTLTGGGVSYEGLAGSLEVEVGELRWENPFGAKIHYRFKDVEGNPLAGSEGCTSAKKGTMPVPSGAATAEIGREAFERAERSNNLVAGASDRPGGSFGLPSGWPFTPPDPQGASVVGCAATTLVPGAVNPFYFFSSELGYDETLALASPVMSRGAGTEVPERLELLHFLELVPRPTEVELAVHRIDPTVALEVSVNGQIVAHLQSGTNVVTTQLPQGWTKIESSIPLSALRAGRNTLVIRERGPLQIQPVTSVFTVRMPSQP